MPAAESRARVRRVSSQQIRSAVASTSRARGERSPRFPIGVATRTSRPRRSSLKARRSLRRSAPRAPRAGRPPARPSARATRPRSRPRSGPCARPSATRQGLSRATRTTVEVDREEGHVDGELHAGRVHGAGALQVQRALAARCAPAGRRARRASRPSRARTPRRRPAAAIRTASTRGYRTPLAHPSRLFRLMSKRTVKRKLRTKKKANHGKKPNCGRG